MHNKLQIKELVYTHFKHNTKDVLVTHMLIRLSQAYTFFFFLHIQHTPVTFTHFS